jgi:L-alanine-DL-glutamate epimerase-like enolase superfamily enzyme
MNLPRRSFLKTLASGAALCALPASSRSENAPDLFQQLSRTTFTTPLFQIEKTLADPVKLATAEIFRFRGEIYLRVRSEDGATGIAAGNSRHPNHLDILKNLVLPTFFGPDLRRIEWLVDDCYRDERNYKYSGLPFWNSVGIAELAILDLLGKRAAKPVWGLTGRDILRREIPVYLSRFERANTAEQETKVVTDHVAKTGVNAVKVKIGGRMSQNRDASPGRTEALVALLRKELGPDFHIYVDGNGSYDSATAIEVGKMLESHRVGFFEEPCPWEEFEETKRVADALDLTIAGGEQDSSLPHFAWMIRHRGVDLIQPDTIYNGGFIRNLRVAKMAELTGMQTTPHSPGDGPKMAYMLHFAAITPNLGPHQEHSFSRRIKGGVVAVPQAPGWGLGPEDKELDQGELLDTVRI